jgi:phosphoribosylglycinamide formyltransferase-1
MSMARKRVAVLISGRGSNMAALVNAAAAPDYPADIALVISNRPEARGLEYARSRGIETVVLDHKSFASREAFDDAVDARLRAERIDLVCLAGFMRLLSTPFIDRWSGRMINIHPSLLPAHKGLHTHARALADHAKTHGCTVHFVVPELDSGPVIMQAEVPVLPGDDEETLAARVLAEEHRIYPAALRLLAEGRLRIDGGEVTVVGAAQ